LRELATVLDSESSEAAVTFRLSVSPRQAGRLRAWAGANGLQLEPANGGNGHPTRRA
jgi:hypothetical protein